MPCREAAVRGHPEVVDADLADYFGSIPHAELVKSVARRIVDRRVLHLIKMWLECPLKKPMIALGGRQVPGYRNGQGSHLSWPGGKTVSFRRNAAVGRIWQIQRSSLFDPGCVKTPKADVRVQQKNRICCLGESFMRERHSV